MWIWIQMLKKRMHNRPVSLLVFKITMLVSL
jgi:hypothetical protein